MRTSKEVTKRMNEYYADSKLTYVKDDAENWYYKDYSGEFRVRKSDYMVYSKFDGQSEWSAESNLYN